MKTLTELTKSELIHELFAANAEFLFAVKHFPKTEEKDQARSNLSRVVAEIERRRYTSVR